MPITVDIQSTKQYSSHCGRRSYQVNITWCNAMLSFWSMSYIISLNQFNHFRAYWTQTNIVTATWNTQRGQWWGIFRLYCCCLFSAIVYRLSLNVSDQVRAGTVPVRGRGAASRVCTRMIDTSQTLPIYSDWLYWPGSFGFLQIKLQSLGGATDSGFLHSWPVSYSTVRS